MRKEQRDVTIGLLFGSMVNQLDELRHSGVEVPSEVFLYLGMLQGNVSGIMDHIAINSDLDIERLKRKLKEKRETEIEEDAEEELPTRMEQVRRKTVTEPPDNIRSPLERHKQTVVNLRDEKPK